ncbi:MAG: SpoIIE family protein phosphatase [Bernardetiaceae bacterium]|nr:SpoIIE family protein phosphatase [Bernardetiaceae bacterium]
MKKKIVLCVDDEQIVLNSLKSEISRHFGNRLRVEVAESAAEALEVLAFLQERGHELVILLSDYVMPNKKGDELLIEVHKELPYAKKILLTGQANLEGIANAINDADLYQYISKPWETYDLMMTLEAALQSYEQQVQLKIQNAELKALNESLEEKVAQRTEELQQSNDQVQASIRYAKRIQTAVLPGLQALNDYFSDSFVFYLPRDVVSGDFYWYAEKENKIIVAAADCTGHGVPGAFMSLIGNDLLNRTVHDKEIHKPDAILTDINRRLGNVWKNEESKISDGMDISVVMIDFEMQKLYYAGAKSPMLLFQNGEQMKYVKPTRQSVDGKTLKRPFELQEFDIKDTKTRFYLYSDGYQDQFGGEHDMKFGSKQLRQMIADLQEESLQKQEESVAKAFQNWQGKKVQIDDVLLMGFEI